MAAPCAIPALKMAMPVPMITAATTTIKAILRNVRMLPPMCEVAGIMRQHCELIVKRPRRECGDYPDELHVKEQNDHAIYPYATGIKVSIMSHCNSSSDRTTLSASNVSCVVNTPIVFMPA